MSSGIFLKIAEVVGYSQDAVHKDQIEIASIDLGMSQHGESIFGPARCTGDAARVRDITLHKRVDGASAGLMRLCCTGKPVAEAVLTVRRPTENQAVMLRMMLGEVTVVSVDVAVAGSEPSAWMETVVLRFNRFHFEYSPEKIKGLLAVPTAFGWDAAASCEDEWQAAKQASSA